ncbi:hypothetical protein [Caulobacter sp.]|uniref:hypothetical protein n=1 Tax=Caulobacter sp. TaxID=78 RepID=UPI001B294CD3|nr:hypothetical protein [Caulobacter sp.]MBO9543124.1 hypothetical protein [Caulobacter sp.]
MKTKILYFALAVVALALGAASSGFAQSGDGDILQKAINKPSANWQVYGPDQKTSPVKDKTVAGGGGMKVEVQKASANPWEVGAQQPITGKVSKNDVILIAFWAKAEAVDGGAAEANLSAVRVQQPAAPYDAAVQGSAKISGAEWKMYTVPGRASMDIPAGGANVSLHLGSAKQTVFLGPVFVLDFGPDYDLKKLAQ